MNIEKRLEEIETKLRIIEANTGIRFDQCCKICGNYMPMGRSCRLRCDFKSTIKKDDIIVLLLDKYIGSNTIIPAGKLCRAKGPSYIEKESGYNNEVIDLIWKGPHGPVEFTTYFGDRWTKLFTGKLLPGENP